MNASTVSARRLVRALLASGVRDVVLSPGSRSAPLVYAWADAEAELAGPPPGGGSPLRLHVRIDERDAAFTALGIAKAGRLAGTHRPVAVVTTSGSAVGNLHPAVMEAAHAHLPLVLVTADRPARLRGTGANQTLDAQHAALPEVVAAWDLPLPAGDDDPTWTTAAEAAVIRACASPGGPVQLNAQFDAPLVPDTEEAGGVPPGPAVGAQSAAGGTDRGGDAARWSAVRDVLADPQSRPVIVAGDDLGFATSTLAALASEFVVPIFAEPSSVLASHPCTIPAHAQLLGRPAAAEALARITHVIVTGRPTLSRPIVQLVDRDDLETVVVPYDADGLVATLTPSCASIARAGTWWAEWSELGSATAGGSSDPTDAAVLALLERPGVLVAASSSTIRHLARLQQPHHRARVVASRGLAGIDGLVATASGIALGLEDQGVLDAPVRLLIGDLAALHDLGGFVVPTHERRPRLQTVVLHDDGGAIFAGLEHSRPHVASRFDRFFGTPHGTDLAEAARALGTEAESVDLRAGADGEHCDEAGAGALERFRRFLDRGAAGVFQLRLPPVRC
ncbi:2-succinyl-5-enolpyruvyl-6-hydroxy-3-cyclohexene-1-carboxylic-acid synthase [Brevibacterium jeotgali]|uniref:2-succinyl-5-enolpyruvyl-6-hydroxy-3-cyclohexene-1-carboxylate synthase n=1 Tax=Brevibacterium jeotgali TaxID=1262550 RepID=A0A2H1L0T8_9MICO|nr:2-succinyl-5-enolpyruvyl-6-hydroxy-3-cyclohexene-1-carboxylic-acid synthase [Brevibacterium jeotgali]TWC02129.1 2-succinyl-5-enolpyruvyl-6-hydroxy-3-cyclohexene-1-carboxylate synthase [Brevibacterium jeotgali]SMY10521.1 2-succinyl-5-enolpyruvyl-6-hydroxy-3-cyclohexene-1-carboxylate synthase [Brevibacterium jeotgali]